MVCYGRYQVWRWRGLHPIQSRHRSTLMVCYGCYQGWRWRGLHPIQSRHRSTLMGLPWTLPGMEVEGSTSNMEQTQVYTGGSAMDTTRGGGGGVYIQYGAEDWSTLMGLPWTLPGMEVEGSISNTEQKKRTSRWRLGGRPQTSEQKLRH